MNRQDSWFRDLRRQRIIDRLARTGRGRSCDELVSELRRALDAEMLLPVPHAWLRAVAETAAAGDAYVISTRTAHREPVPAPESTERPFGID